MKVIPELIVDTPALDKATEREILKTNVRFFSTEQAPEPQARDGPSQMRKRIRTTGTGHHQHTAPAVTSPPTAAVSGLGGDGHPPPRLRTKEKCS